MLISILIPSRLAKLPNTSHDELWLDRAVASVMAQQLPESVELEIIVGPDPLQELAERFRNRCKSVTAKNPG